MTNCRQFPREFPILQPRRRERIGLVKRRMVITTAFNYKHFVHSFVTSRATAWGNKNRYYFWQHERHPSPPFRFTDTRWMWILKEISPCQGSIHPYFSITTCSVYFIPYLYCSNHHSALTGAKLCAKQSRGQQSNLLVKLVINESKCNSIDFLMN